MGNFVDINVFVYPSEISGAPAIDFIATRRMPPTLPLEFNLSSIGHFTLYSTFGGPKNAVALYECEKIGAGHTIGESPLNKDCECLGYADSIDTTSNTGPHPSSILLSWLNGTTGGQALINQNGMGGLTQCTNYSTGKVCTPSPYFGPPPP
jgi:hypothetical protein